MMSRRTTAGFFLTIFLLLASAGLHAQQGPVAGKPYSLVYNPPAGSELSRASSVTLYYVFDFWNVRYGTRLALWQNVLRPDTSRLRSVQLEKVAESWRGTFDIPSDAALLSWIVSDGRAMDGNNERTFVEYILGDDRKPVRNARYFNVQFQRLAGSDLGTMVMEMERELAEYPDNFPAYHQYFSLLIEQGRGSTRIQERILAKLSELEKVHATNDEFLNLAAQTWYYLLQDQKRGLEYREKIAPGQHWPQVLRMFDREGKETEDMERQMQSRNRRDQLRNTELPEFNLKTPAGDKSGFTRRNGKPLILLYCATTSELSLILIDDVQEMLKKLSGKDFDLAFVSVDPEEERAVTAATSRGFKEHLFFNQGSALQILGIDSLPILYAVDANDIVRAVQVGYSPAQAEDLRKVLETISE